jgi:hypothetical protein
MQTDERSFRIAVVPSELVNDGVVEFDVLQVLEQAGWGAIVLPPTWYPPELTSDLLTQFAEHIEEFVRHGYDVVCVDSCEALSAPLAELGVAMPDTAPATASDELSEFLLSRAAPRARR